MEPTDVTVFVALDEDSTEPPRIDDDSPLRIVGQGCSAADAVAAICRLAPDLVILCVRDRPGVALSICHEINRIGLGTQVVVRAERDDDRSLAAFVRAGVQGYVTRSMSNDESLHVFLDVAQGRRVFPRPIARRVRTLVMEGGSPRTDSALTDRETQVLEQMSCGLRNQEIAATLGISSKTVETHVRRVLLKMGATSRTQAVARAIRSRHF